MKIYNFLIFASLIFVIISKSFAGSCADGSEPIKSVSEDGTYFVYSCFSHNSNSNAGTVSPETLYESTKSGKWFSTNGLPMWTPHYAKFQLVFTDMSKSYTAGNFAIADFDGDGIDDYFQLTPPKQSGVDWDEVGPTCRTNLGECYDDRGSVSVFKVDKKGKKYYAKDVSGLIDWGDNIKLIGTSPTDLHIADFNGDGKLDIFATDTANIDAKFLGKNDAYLLSNAEGLGWTESTATHVTGTNVQKGKGLINFSHGSTVGDIDGDGDIDIVVTSIVWRGAHAEDPNMNGEIWCYVNQGDGHMKVRRCGNQWGKTAALGDMDNDGDLDLVWGSETMESIKVWDNWNRVPGCFRKLGNSWFKKDKCNGSFNGILLNDGIGNFYQRGATFEDAINSSGFAYYSVPAASVADLDGDGDLDVIRSHVGHVYAGAGMTIEENLGNGTFKMIFYSEFCESPKSKDYWPRQEGSSYNCWVSDYKFSDFNKDGLIDIYLDGHDANRSNVVKDGAILMSRGKFNYDIKLPSPAKYPGGFKPVDEDYPLIEIKIMKQPKVFEKILTSEEEAEEQQSVEDEIAAFEAELAAQAK